MLTHVVMFKLKERTQVLVDETVAMLTSLEGVVPTLRRLEIGVDAIHTARSYDLVLIADFDDKEGLNAYMIHPEHLKVVEFLDQVMEPRIVVDFVS